MAISILDDYPPGTRCGNTCSCCKAGRRDLGYGRREKVVDLHEQIDFEGHLLICESCVREAAAMLGMVDPVERDEAVAAMHELQAAADEAKSERDEAYQLVDLLRTHDGRAATTASQLQHMPDPYEHAAAVAGLPDSTAVSTEEFTGDYAAASVKPARRPRAAKTV